MKDGWEEQTDRKERKKEREREERGKIDRDRRLTAFAVYNVFGKMYKEKMREK